MSQALSARLKSWLVKGFLLVIVLSFAVWGIGDIFRGGQDPTVIGVGDVKIAASEFSAEYGRQLQRMRQLTRGAIDAEQAKALGLVDQTIEQMITRSVLAQARARLAMTLSDQAVVAELRQLPALQNEVNEFDRQRFYSVLAENRMSEPQFIDMLRQDIVSRQFVGSLTAAAAAPATLVDILQRYRSERRVAELLVITTDGVAEPADPSDAELDAYDRENQDAFTAPEYRKVAFVVLRPADMVGEIEIDEDSMRTEYEDRLEAYTVAETRDLDMIVFADQDSAKSGHERIIGGADLFAVAQDLAGKSESDVKLGLVTKDAMPAEIADPVFTLAEGAVSGPLESPLGWYIVRVNKVNPGGTKSFEEARAEIRESLAAVRAIDAIYELSTRLEDELAGGATIEDAARAIGLEAQTIEAVDAAGLDPTGTGVATLPSVPSFLPTVYRTSVGETSPLTEGEANTLFVLRVDGITPPALRPFDLVRDQAVSGWKERARARAAEALANQIASEQAGGASMQALADSHGLSLTTTTAFTRDGRDLNAEIGRAVVDAIFYLAPNAATGAVADGPGRFVIARLKEITPGDPNEQREALLDAVRGGIEADIRTSFEQALRERQSIRVARDLIDTLIQ
jgi:peptidyl-prolyl cis-trans isomerase D